MQVTLQLPEDLALLLGADAKDVSRVVLEALILEGIRAGKLTVAQGRTVLGIPSLYQMDGFLKEHGVLLALSQADLERDVETALSFRK